MKGKKSSKRAKMLLSTGIWCFSHTFYNAQLVFINNYNHLQLSVTLSGPWKAHCPNIDVYCHLWGDRSRDQTCTTESFWTRWCWRRRGLGLNCWNLTHRSEHWGDLKKQQQPPRMIYFAIDVVNNLSIDILKVSSFFLFVYYFFEQWLRFRQRAEICIYLIHVISDHN